MIGTTIPHQVEGRFSSSKVRLIPASPGTGVVAGGTVRAVLEMAGVTDCLTKCYGSTNKRNIVKAVFAGLDMLKQSGQISALRGTSLGQTDIESKIERGKRFMPAAPKGEKMRGPVNTVASERRGGRQGGRRRRDDSGGGQQTGAPAPTGGAPTPPPSAG
jgi:small subunit ribosomal protein S5